MTRLYKEHGWDKKAYVYVLDETTKMRRSARRRSTPRRCTPPTGRRAPGSSSCSPTTRGPHSLGGIKTANTFLYDDVDIWMLRYYYFFGRIPAVRERQRAGKEIWWYTYANDSVRSDARPSSSTSRTSIRASGAG